MRFAGIVAMVSGNKWSAVPDAELVQAWINNVLTYDAIEHVGAANRQMDQRFKILRELKDRSSGSLLQLRPLLQHSDLNIRYVAALQFRVPDPVAFRDTMEFLQGVGGDIGRSTHVGRATAGDAFGTYRSCST